MASTDGGGARLATTSRENLINGNGNDNDNDNDNDSDTSDTESLSSSASALSPCPYRSSRFSDDECARFLDCPTHRRARPLNIENVEAEQEESEEDHHHHDNTDSSAPLPPQPRFGTFILDHGSQRLIWETGETSMERTDGPSRVNDIDTHALAEDDHSTEGPITLREALQEGGPRNNSTTGVSMSALLPRLNNLTTSNPSPNSSSNSPQNWPTAPAYWPPSSQQGQSQSQSHIQSHTQSHTQSQGQGQGQGPRIDFTLPRWQPDAEVTRCPICGSQFGFFIRKHHCRKCGRVVCATCSPHRITIPYQYIVRPPGETAYLRGYGLEGNIADFSYLAGGEPVRLCNPCVPDPNTTPPGTRHFSSLFHQRRNTHHRSQSAESNNVPAEHQFTHHTQPPVPNILSDYNARSRSATVNNGSNSLWTDTAGTSAQYGARWPGASPYQQLPYQPFPPRLPSSLNARVRYLLDSSEPSSSSSSGPRGRDPGFNRPLPPPPQIAEEDECPVCHYELPSRELLDFEARREAHINECIAQHSTYSPNRRASNPLAPTSAVGPHGTPSPRMTRRTGIFPYTATEKDCVDDAECTICLEEFQPGVPMARLECLCRFHRSCINAWFVNHPGRCPVHQHDSFGY